MKRKIGRRQLLQGFLTVPALLYLHSVRADNPESRPASRRNRFSEEWDADAIVIGAGASGLAAARSLADEDYNVIVIEGRDRIGGRVWTDRSWPDMPVDMGGSWIHGIRGNPLWDLKREFQIETMPTDYDSHFVYDFTGRRLPEKEVEEMEGLFEEILEEIETFREEEEEASLEYGFQSVIRDLEVPPAMLRKMNFLMNTQIEHDYGADSSDLSLQNYDSDEMLPGGDVLFPGGYGQIMDRLAKGLDIRLKHVVRRISYGDRQVAVQTNQGEVTAGCAIVTVPLGVLQSGTILFEPALPEWKQKAIRGLRMGVLNKVYLRFEESFWPKDPHFLAFISERKGEWGEWLNFFHYTGRPLLLAFNAGTYGTNLEKKDDRQIVKEGMSVLRTVFGSSVPDPAGWKISRWASDPFARGSYSHIPPGSSMKDNDALSRPVQDRLFFAGEATNTDFPGTVHGAYLSGIREAKRILQLANTNHIHPTAVVSSCRGIDTTDEMARK